jgi:predicted DNA-binding transcriptional regulator AlpA
MSKPDSAGHPLPLRPLLVGAREAARLCSRSEASWWRDNAQGRIPRPLKVGGRTLWSVRELERWIAEGCPSRRVFEGGKPHGHA